MADLIITERQDIVAIADAVRSKTGNTNELTLSGIVSGIRGIETGGGETSSNPSASPKDVNFYDYDGTLLYSYTVEEAQALTELPDLPTQKGLICQGWNYDLDTIKSYNRAVDVGATYITDDGKTRLYIRIAAEGRMTVPLFFSQTVANGVTIDWGDGSVTNNISGTGEKNVSHTYTAVGDYVISLSVKSGCTIKFGRSTSTYCILGPTSYAYPKMLKKVEIGDGVTNIYSYAFSQCCSLSNITIPLSVTDIVNYAFYRCCALKHINIPLSVTSIGSYAFQDCHTLNNITIPSSVISIGSSAFVNCYNLNNITIPSNVTSIAAFSSCYTLNNIIIPNSVTSIGNSAFQGCRALNNITIPSSVTSIGNYAFSSCGAIANITIPSSVTSIGDYAFYACSGMAIYDFTSHASVPTLSNTNAFSNIPSDCVIKVPAALYDEWIAATNWSTYASKIVAI